MAEATLEFMRGLKERGVPLEIASVRNRTSSQGSTSTSRALGVPLQSR
jgi:hypothetical protein